MSSFFGDAVQQVTEQDVQILDAYELYANVSLSVSTMGIDWTPQQDKIAQLRAEVPAPRV